jgi:hypothetical protein
MRCRYVLLLVLWILWSELIGNLEKGVWQYVDTFETRQLCEESARQAASRMKQRPFVKKILSSGSAHFTYVSDKGSTYTLAYNCVPDTVDPRPK